MLNPEILEVLDRLDMESYLDREGVEYRRAHGSRGPQLNIRECPKCGNDKWKVFLNAETGLGNCFHGDCEAKYNKFSFIRAHTGLGGRSLDEHITAVGQEIGWQPRRKATVAVKTDLSDLVLPPSFEIPIEGRNLRYLTQRGIGIDIAKYFHLRFCKKGWFKYKFDGEDKFMKFDDRILIPVFDLEGTMVSFQGRDITGKAEKKYLFPPGFAATGEHLYNGQNVHGTERVLVGEGVFDVMAQKIALDEDVALRDVVPVGTFGKHLSENQIHRFMELHKRGVRQVTFMWDSEPEAIQGMIKSGLTLRGYGFDVRIALLPEGKDPNEVPTEVVRNAYWSATTLNRGSALKLMMRLRK